MSTSSAAASEPEKRRSLEYWLARATDPYTVDDPAERQSYTDSFCDQVNDELEGPSIAARLLIHEIQSPDAQRAMQALMVLDTCVERCGARFHSEVGKFKFLNELIRLLSPKYLASQTGENVKRRIVELLYIWKHTLNTNCGKINEAYNLLRQQRIVTGDPTYLDELIQLKTADNAARRPPPQMASFEDEQKSRLLATLLASGSAEDLIAANRLIKSLVKAEDQRIEAKCKRSSDIQAAGNNMHLLNDMLHQFSAATSTSGDVQLMRELYNTLYHSRQTLFRYAGELAIDAEEGEMLAELLTINDDINRAIDEYKSIVVPHLHRFYLPSPQQQASNATQMMPKLTHQNTTDQLLQLDDMLDQHAATFESLDLSASSTPASVGTPRNGAIIDSTQTTPGSPVRQPHQKTIRKNPNTNVLDQLLPEGQLPIATEQRLRQNMPLRDLLAESSSSNTAHKVVLPMEQKTHIISVPDVAAIKISDRPPFVLFEFHQLRCVLFYGEKSSDWRNEFVASMTSTNQKTIKDLKLMIKLKTGTDASSSGDQLHCGTATGSCLAPFSPLHTTHSSVSLPMVIVTSTSQCVRLAYTLSFVLADEDEGDEVMTSATVQVPL